MDIRELRYLVAVADGGSFSQAASRLFVTRQAVAKTVASIESETGMRVFERHEQRLTPTGKGAELIADARRVVSVFDEAIGPYLALPDYGAAAGRRKAQEGILRIAIVTGAGRWALAPGTIDRLRAQCAQVTLSLEEMSSDAVCSAVEAGDVDLGIAITHPDFLAGLDYRPLVRSNAAWLWMADNHPLASLDLLHLSDLQGRSFVTGGPRDHSHRFFMGRCKAANVHPVLAGIATDVVTIGQLIAEHGALCPGSDPSVVPLAPHTVAKPVALPGGDIFGTYLLRRRGGQQLAPLAQHLWDTL